MEELFKDKKYCLSEIGKARKIFTSKSAFTKEKVEPMEKALGLMYLYCPSDIQDIVLSTLEELGTRACYL